MEVKIPVVINTGKLKVNNTGQNVISSAQSVASARGLGKQEEKVASGQAQLLDESAISSATTKELLDESY